MKKDPTRLILAMWAVLGVLGAPASWYFLYVRGPYEPSDLTLLCGLVGGMLGTALCVFLLVDAPNAKARFIWAVMLISAIVSSMSKLPIFAPLARHHDLIVCISGTVRTVFWVALLIAHMCAPFTLFGKRTEAYFEKARARKAKAKNSRDSTHNSLR